MKTIELTPEQATIHLFALEVHIQRMKRRAEVLSWKEEDHKRRGENALALKMADAKNLRLRMIAETQKELERMESIFGRRRKNG